MFLLQKLQAMLKALLLPVTWPWSVLQRLFAGNLPDWARYVVEVISVLVVATLAILLGLWLKIEGDVDATGPLRVLWPGIVIVLSYLTIRLFIFVIQQMPSIQAEFPDIDEAIAAGLDATANARAPLNDVPLFLVVGLPPALEDAFFTSPSIGRSIRVVGDDLPVHWFGDSNAVWVTLPGVSAVSRQVSYESADSHSAQQSPGSVLGGLHDAGSMTGRGGPAVAHEDDAYTSLQFDAESIRVLSSLAEPQQPIPTPRRSKAAKGLAVHEREEIRRRITHFSESLREIRYPVCTVNGVLLVLPFYSHPNPDDVNRLSEGVATDMVALQETLGVKCLSLTLFAGIEESAGFAEYVSRLPEENTKRRCGVSFPQLIEMQENDSEGLHDWLVTYFERQVLSLQKAKLGDPGNGKLFRFLDSFRKTREYFTRMLKSAFPAQVEEPFYFGGVYFAGTGQTGEVSRPFFEGVIRKLLGEHDDMIGWNDRATEEDRKSRGLSRILMTAVVVLLLGNAGLLVAIAADAFGL